MRFFSAESEARSLLQVTPVLILAYLLLAMSSIALTSETAVLAPLWYANSLAALFLLSRHPREWPVMIAGLVFAIILSNAIFGKKFPLILIYLCGNILEVVLSASLLRYFYQKKINRFGAGALLKFLLVGGVIPAGIGAVVGSTGLYYYTEKSFGQLFMLWFESSALGSVSILPIGLFLVMVGVRRGLSEIARPVALAVLLATALCSTWLIYSADYPYIYITTILFFVSSFSKYSITAVAALIVSAIVGSFTALSLFVPVNEHQAFGITTTYLPLALTLLPPVVFAANLAQQKRQLFQLETLAHTDRLTSLPTREKLEGAISEMCRNDQRHDDKFSVLYIDLDGFKAVNDRLGHHIGDELLKLISQRVTEVLRAGDIISRVGGDEFVVLVRGAKRKSDSELVAAKIMQAISTITSVAQKDVSIGASIGIARYPENGKTAYDLIKNADKAMYFSKKGGGDRYAFSHRS